MKVLWFANTSCNADEYFNSELKGTGGWLKALDQKISSEVDLHVAFYYPRYMAPFSYKGTRYYPICTGNTTKIKKYINKVLIKEIFKEDLPLYLNIVEQVQPDIIHIHGTETPFGYLIPEVRVPTIISIQGNLTLCHHKFYSGIEKQNSKVSKNTIDFFLGNLSFPIWYKRFKVRGKREREILLNSKNVMGRTFWDKNITSILSPHAQYYIGQETMRDVFYKSNWSPKKNAKKNVFTTSGNIIYKGFETLCYALSLLNSDTSIDITWSVAGVSESDDIVLATKKQLGDKYPQDNLILLGNINENQLVNALLDADVYVMTSHIENSPNNLCEAMLLGLPCIATYVGGTASMMEHNEEGILIQDGDPWAMAGAIKNMLSDDTLAFQLGEMAKNKARERHNPTVIVDNLLSTYEEIIDKVRYS